MIESYKAITGRYLKAKKKRTTLTLIGIILSVALICTIGLFIKGIQKAETDSLKRDYGSYHVAFKKVDDNLYSKISNNPKVSRYGLYKEGKSIQIDDKRSYSIITATGKALELASYSANKGRLPENSKEVAIESWILPYIDKNAHVGDKITINNNECKLVGILEDNIGTQIKNCGLVVTKDDHLSKGDSSLLVEISSKTNLKKAVKEMEQLTNKENIQKNSYIISIEGGSEDSNMKGIYSAVGVVITIVLIATIAVIYNSFQISVVERIKQFGLLRAVGTTPKQIRRIVLREATILAAIGVPIGLILGIGAMASISVVFKIIGGSNLTITTLTISPMVLALSALVGLISIYVSALLPAIHAGRISPLTAISSRTSIKKEKIKKRKNTIIQKMFGFEGAMAAKNIRRNRKRYRITVFSIVISVVLFISFKYFTDTAITVNGRVTDSADINFNVYDSSGDKSTSSSISSSMIDSINSLSCIKNLYKIYETNTFNAALDRKSEISEVKDMKLMKDDKSQENNKIYKEISYNSKDKVQMYANTNIYTKEEFDKAKKYIKSGSIDIDNLNKENGVIIIDHNSVYNSKIKRTYIGPIADVKVGDEILLQSDQGDNAAFGNGKVKSVKVMAILKDAPFDYSGYSSALKMITTEEVAKKLLDKDTLNVSGLNITTNNENDDKAAKEAIEKVISSNPSLKLVNVMDENKQMKSGVLMIQILLYGFVVVISLISSVNIINTLTTNIILRRREFATLKSIGLTQKGLRKMIVLEGLLYGIMGSIYGSVIGTGFCYLIFKGVYNIRQLRWNTPWEAIIIAAVCALALGFLSVISPLQRIKKDNLIETIREE